MSTGQGCSLSRLCILLFALLPVWSVQAEHQVRVGIYDNPPKIFVSDAGEPSGILVEVLQAIASREGWTLEFQPCTWQECLALLEAGQLDLMPDVALSEERLERFAFHQVPALDSWSQIYRDPAVHLESLLDLQGKRIALLEGSVQQPALNHLLEGFELDYIPIAVASLDEAFARVAAGEADAAISNYQFGGYRAADYGLRETPIVLMPSQLYYAAPQEEAHLFLPTLDSYLEDWRSSAASPYYDILRRWGGREPETLVPAYLTRVLTALVLLGLLLLAGVLFLRRKVRERTRELEALNQHLEHLAHYDLLTGLPNRLLLTEKLQIAMQEADERQELLLVAFIDLDAFKQINDRYGNKRGDQLLKAISRELQCHLDDQACLGRVGGDEFVLVLRQLEDCQTGKHLSGQLLNLLAQPFQLDCLQVKISGSMGLCFYPQEGISTADQLIRQANQAMYQAKLEGKNGCYEFDAEKDRYVRGYYETLERIRQGLHEEELLLYYQPKVNLRTGRVIGVEALIRWQHPQRGLLPPAAFLPVVEGQPLDAELGHWVLQRALQQLSAWQAEGLVLPISINISAYHLQTPDFVSQLRSALAHFPHLRPEHLELEVLETSALEDVLQISEVMRAVHKLGVGFALDDFGTGYSSLTYLKRLPADLLKIDRSFVLDLLEDEEDRALVEGVIRLAAAFQRQVLAEGVETRAQGECLLQLGCELVQGYGIARPLPAEEIPAWVERWEKNEAWDFQKLVSA
ncbi:EAL domain-containing protein [Marinospirillum perlucidum]|uniref:EAL domain-containing protein n=1 Tax=Marinospirillum perlucidum TaxID=1982602 RepID=UPI000DF440D5|nr:EAL domain-containing protein [Marinospirillum perlucidum]